MNIHQYMHLKIDLAEIYAEDGAFHSVARVLRELADHVEDHAKKADAFVEAMIAEGKCEREVRLG